MFESMTTVQQGTVGLGRAIKHFTERNLTVSLPLNDNQRYDLVVEIDGKLNKVQVKTTSHKKKKSQYYIVDLRSIMANKSENKIHKFDSSEYDLLFVLAENGDEYLIPIKEINIVNALSLGEKAKQWKIGR